MEIVEHYTCLEWTTVGAQLILELRGSVDCHAQNPALLPPSPEELAARPPPTSIAKVETMATLIIIIAAWEEVATRKSAFS